MQDQIQQRLAELKKEYAAGQDQLRELEARTEELKQALLRISGAIQVLEELTAKPHGGSHAPEENQDTTPGRPT